jgi:DNA-directed RNA polymerase subunit M/transcription elongation factor TFIIS
MDRQQPAGRTCPACGSTDYSFRSRKKIEAAEGQQPAVETKYRCKACGHEWKLRVTSPYRSRGSA